jgi:formylglycine-generating enzyme required for sulfatase activity
MGKNWAIAVGINTYDNLQPLKYAERDAEAMAAWFRQEAKFDEVFLFTEHSPPIYQANPPIPTQPNYARFQRFLDVQFEKPLLKSEDNLWFFFAGHGIRYADQDYLMFLDSNPKSLDKTAISVDYVTQRLRRSGADNVVLLLDACRDESSRSGLGIGEQRHQGVITFYSCTANQKSWEIEELQHGSFTHALLAGLRIAGEGNCATVERLDRYLKSTVPTINQKYQKTPQNPYVAAEPATKLHLILLPDYATLNDINQLKLDAREAEDEKDWELAEQLWMRVNVAARGSDTDVKKAWIRIEGQKRQFSAHPTPKPVTPPNGGRSVTPERPTFNFDVVTVNAKGQEVKREKGQAEYFTEDLGNGVILEMVNIPSGEFIMGSPSGEGLDDEKPQHQVTLKSFFMSKYPVTQAQWRKVAALPKVNRDLEADPSKFKGDNRPVEQVSWDDAVEFCSRLTKDRKNEYRLPSEAEWEYACRAGTTTPFHYGETITSELANYDGNYTYASEPKGEYRKQTTEVGRFPPNCFGLYDMHGNVWEWCLDDWHDSYQGAPTDGSPWFVKNNKPDEKTGRAVLRGGSWFDAPAICRSAYRYFNLYRDVHYNIIGFRVVCAAGRILP